MNIEGNILWFWPLLDLVLFLVLALLAHWALGTW